MGGAEIDLVSSSGNNKYGEAVEEVVVKQSVVSSETINHEQNQQVRPHEVLAGGNNQYQSVISKEAGAEVVSLPAFAPIIASFLMSPLITYTILTLLLIVIIWIVVGKKIWNIWKKK